MSKITIGTWNVNSIRARFDQVKQVLSENHIDVLLLQETKVQDIDFPEFFFKDFGYNLIYKGQKSYNGVAIVSRIPLELNTDYLPFYSICEQDLEARYIEAGFTVNKKYITVSSVYVPNGASLEEVKLEESLRFNYKLTFFDRLIQHLSAFDLENDFVLFGGDFNVAKDEIDLFNPQANKGDVGFHDDERIRLKTLISRGMYDLFREKNGNEVAYTWWDYRTKAFDRDVGWRLDYLFGSKQILNSMTDCKILKSLRGMKKASDHTLVTVDLDIK